MSTFSCTQTLLSNNDYLQMLGWCMAVALVIGGLIDEGPKRLTNWIFAAVAFAAIEEVARYIYLSGVHVNIREQFMCASSGITISVSVVYIIGLVVGWIIVYSARKYTRRTYLKHIEQTSQTQSSVEDRKKGVWR